MDMDMAFHRLRLRSSDPLSAKEIIVYGHFWRWRADVGVDHHDLTELGSLTVEKAEIRCKLHSLKETDSSRKYRPHWQLEETAPD